MNCLEDGILRAKLDGQLAEEESRAIEKHLAVCAACRLRLETLSANADRVRTALETLAPGPHEAFSDPPIAFARFHAQGEEVPRASSLSRLFSARLRPVWAAAGLAAVLVACFGFAPARSWAQRVLAMLRVQKIAVVPIDTQGPQGVQSGNGAGRLIDQFISDNIVVTEHSGQPQIAADAAQANQLAGFQVRLLADRSDAPKISVEGEAGFQMTSTGIVCKASLTSWGGAICNCPPPSMALWWRCTFPSR